MSEPQVTSFANHILPDWEDAMSRFFAVVETKMHARSLTPAEVRRALDEGYGDEIGDDWDEWITS